MGIDKSRFKMAVAHELGASFDDTLERANEDVHKWAGAKKALGEAAVGIDKLLAHIAQDVKDEKMTIEESNAAQQWVRRAAEICRNLQLRADVHEHRAGGRVEALKTVVEITKKYHDKEKAKATTLLISADETALVADGEIPRRPSARPVGVRPENHIGALKQAEQKTE
jgi:hypothetical protein